MDIIDVFYQSDKLFISKLLNRSVEIMGILLKCLSSSDFPMDKFMKHTQHYREAEKFV